MSLLSVRRCSDRKSVLSLMCTRQQVSSSMRFRRSKAEIALKIQEDGSNQENG